VIFVEKNRHWQQWLNSEWIPLVIPGERHYAIRRQVKGNVEQQQGRWLSLARAQAECDKLNREAA